MSGAQLLDIALKTAMAAVFFFLLQYAILKAPMDISLMWGASMGCAAAALAWMQHTRGSR